MSEPIGGRGKVVKWLKDLDSNCDSLLDIGLFSGLLLKLHAEG